MGRKRCLNFAQCGQYVTSGSRCTRCLGAQKAKYADPEYKRNRPRVLARDGYLCHLRLRGCLLEATTADHIDPRGGNGMSNLQAACKPCNSAKRDR